MDHSPNRAAAELWSSLPADPQARVQGHLIADANVLDFGVETPGSIRAGLLLARACMGGLGRVSIVPCDAARYAVANTVFVETDFPRLGCLGCQYAGWPVQSDDYFAMGSGPMRLLRGKEAMLIEQGLSDSRTDAACGVLESDKLPTASAIESIASDCGVPAKSVTVAVAPSTSIAGSIQIVARSVETAMHKLDDLKFDVRSVVSATGSAPLPPPAKSGDTIGGIGRTNDAMLYGANVSLWVDCPDDAIESILDKIPSSASPDHGRPFRTIFADYNHDFYAVDPSLFSPAVVTLHNLRSGRTFTAGRIVTEILRESFGT
ncbi:Methenyltetrahydromethanopterin cyclohydrolase [Stieleria maiorica]|uniref:Methenyltetrahydromethanopterin cyclohydrolase n=1 Tax=Stieleria maiorica TaxID=2795974 RepID=A0A5B9MI67_9BACT|nr:methenyltetrahydromethanopterin cyclohydrolase [Stieleria maiorica]QEF99334.1 Methenyltetrahydromethanopterin cyclohydrolase [Stieleria maiorica]